MSLSELALPAPAKLNLMLHIVGQRADGYHLLQTVFQFLDYGDELTFRLTQDGRISRSATQHAVPPEQDLIVRAASVLQDKAGTGQGVQIHIDKRLPMGGGLGGGSSDAATTLLALNKLWQLEFSTDELAQLGLSLGADVPVFVRGHAAWAEGVGEQLQPVDLPEPWFVVIAPGCAVSTAEIFSDSDLTRNSPLTTIADFLEHGGHNDCEPVVRRRYPQIAQLMDWLQQFAQPRLTGTGACIFASFANESDARKVQQQTPQGCQAFVARGCNRSPLLKVLDNY
ncbi:MAG: 4-(cytidine 5'-diphospho)-2-C-methyl-D-erythritol kinase [Chromatiales bacterium]|jgi:4-diphosphocytidyl-2-C-methyl-D-erythritol kinase